MARAAHVEVSLETIYDAVRETHDTVLQLVEREKVTTKQADDHEGRIRVLEQLRWAIPFGTALAGIGAGVARAVVR